MADNTDETYPDNPANNHPESSPGENIFASEQETIHSTQAPATMEVHHHPDIHHQSKKWKEYVLEFLMIFLAVTMGFIAENIREHFSETKIAHQNLVAYRNDLLQHQTYLKATAAGFNKVLPVYDSIIAIFYEKKENTELPVLSRLLLQGQLNRIISINTPTYTQLINSGSLRFIDNTELKAGMANYQDQINAYINYNDRMVNTINNQLGELGKIEDIHDFWSRGKMDKGLMYTPEMRPFSLSNEQRSFMIAYNKIFSIQFQVGLLRIKELLKENAALIQLLDKEI